MRHVTSASTAELSSKPSAFWRFHVRKGTNPENPFPFSSWLGFFFFFFFNFILKFFFNPLPFFSPSSSFFVFLFLFFLWFVLAGMMWTLTALGVWQKIFKDAGLVLLVWLLSFYLGANTVDASDRSGRACFLPSGPHSQSQHLFVCVCVCARACGAFIYLFIYFLFDLILLRSDLQKRCNDRSAFYWSRVSGLLQQNAEGNTT